MSLIERICNKVERIWYSLCLKLPVDSRLIVFETERDFWDNGWALYDYMNCHNLDYKYVWIVANPNKFHKTKNTTFCSRFGNGIHWKSKYYYARARYVIFTHWTDDLKRVKGQTSIYMGHGLPLKREKSTIRKVFFDYGISIGKESNKYHAMFLDCNENEMIPLGYPRNDLLLKNIGDGKNNPIGDMGQYAKVILWMPTFRASLNRNLSENSCDTDTGLPLLSSEAKLRNFDEYLKSKNVMLLVKVHRLQADKEVFHNTFFNIRIITDDILVENNLQLYQFVGKTDALISDYSSVSVDYLLLNKPIGYILDDMEQYSKERGFCFDNVLDVMPGHHIYTEQELRDFVNDIVCNKDLFENQRTLVCHKYHDSYQGDACEKFVSFFKM